MVFDIVSPLSVRVFAALAAASSVLFTVYAAPSGLVLRAVLDIHDVRAPLATMATTCWTPMFDTRTDTVLPAISTLSMVVTRPGQDVLNVMPSPLLQLANRLTTSAELYVSPNMTQLYALGSGTVTGSRRIASDYPGTRLVDYFRIFAGFRADTMLATFSVSHLWETLGFSLICFILYSLWIFFSFEAPLDDNDLRLITTLNTQVIHTIRKIESLSKQLQNQIPHSLAAISFLAVFWPAQLLRIRCYTIPSPHVAYSEDNLGELRCDGPSFSKLQQRLTRAILIFMTRSVSLVIMALVIVLSLTYFGVALYTIWNAYLSVKVSTVQTIENISPNTQSPADPSPQVPDSLCCRRSIRANSLSPRFAEDYYIHPDFDAQYEIGAMLGAGGNGLVFEARRRQDGQHVAVKFVKKPEWAARRWHNHPKYGLVNNDVRTMDLAQHENIITLLDVFSDDTYLYIVQELHGSLWHPTSESNKRRWPNGSRCLESFLRTRGPMPLEDAKYVFYQLVDAVAHLHSKGISHCDIKPENILIDTELKIKLIDFGNVMCLPDDCNPFEGRLLLGEAKRFRGTSTYTPPEIHNDEEYETMAADVWAMGLVMCYMVVGHLPFSSVESIKKGEFDYDIACDDWQALLPVWYIVGSCLNMDHMWRPRAYQLQWREGWMPIAIEHQKFIGVNWESLTRSDFKYRVP